MIAALILAGWVVTAFAGIEDADLQDFLTCTFNGAAHVEKLYSIVIIL